MRASNNLESKDLFRHIIVLARNVELRLFDPNWENLEVEAKNLKCSSENAVNLFTCKTCSEQYIQKIFSQSLITIDVPRETS